MTDDRKLPPIGSFPFYDQSKNLFEIWAKSLDAQARVMNEQWGKLKDGTYEAKDWYSSIIKAAELSMSTAEEMFFEVAGVPSPPWVSLKHSSTEETPVKLRVTLATDDKLSASNLSKLGADIVEPKKLPTIQVTPILGDSRTIKVTVGNSENVEPGQYIGFIMRSTSPEPIAIVTVTR